MSDSTIRTAERMFRADPSDGRQAILLQARLRAGSICPSNLELAAYCGHDVAQNVLGGIRSLHDPLVSSRALAFKPWVAGLCKWGDVPHVVASIAAARVAAVYTLGLGLPQFRAAIDAAERWLGCPCRLHRGLWGDAWLATLPGVGNRTHDWLPRPVGSRGDSTKSWRQDGTTILNCAGIAGQEPVEVAVRRRLIEWALA